MTAGAAALIGLDWGTTSLRAFLFGADGRVLARRDAADGIKSAAADGFEAVMRRHVEPWRAEAPRAPIIASGMIGSRNGWIETPYLAPPVGAREIAAGLIALALEDGATVHFAPGVSADPPGGAPDVMRGEETEIVGLRRSGGALAEPERAMVVLPGSHSKWVALDHGRIAQFRTFVTGELFAAVADHTILGALAETGPFDAEAFDAAVDLSAAGDQPLLHLLFGARTRVLFGRLAPASVRDHLSGLLIGAECAAAWRADGAAGPVVAGRGDLTDRYTRALRRLGAEPIAAQPDAAARGLWRIAAAAGLAPLLEGDA